MGQAGVRPNVVSYTALVKGYGQAGQPRAAARLLATMQVAVIPVFSTNVCWKSY